MAILALVRRLQTVSIIAVPRRRRYDDDRYSLKPACKGFELCWHLLGSLSQILNRIVQQHRQFAVGAHTQLGRFSPKWESTLHLGEHFCKICVHLESALTFISFGELGRFNSITAIKLSYCKVQRNRTITLIINIHN